MHDSLGGTDTALNPMRNALQQRSGGRPSVVLGIEQVAHGSITMFHAMGLSSRDCW